MPSTKANRLMSMSPLRLRSVPWRQPLIAFVLVACSAATSASGVDPSLNIQALSEPDQKTFCDWKASVYGGYGKEKPWSCPNGQSGTLAAPKDQAACLQFFHPMLSSSKANCKTTVEQAEGCETRVYDNPCALATVECINYLGCGI